MLDWPLYMYMYTTATEVTFGNFKEDLAPYPAAYPITQNQILLPPIHDVCNHLS